MKKFLKVTVLTVMLMIVGNFANTAFAQGPPPTPPATGSGNPGSNPIGGPSGPGAPIGNGELFLLALAGMYGLQKAYSKKNAISNING